MVNVLLYAVLSLQVGQPQSIAKPAPPVEVSQREVAQHRLDQQPLYLHVAKQHEFEDYLEVSVTVDRTGSVISTEVDVTGRNAPYKNSQATLAEAASMVRNLKYSPFTRSGKPVIVQFTEDVFLLPPELKPPEHVPFPHVRDWNSVRVTLVRTACFGTCPGYSVEISGNGAVTYNGKIDVTFRGRHTGLTEPRRVVDLVKRFEKADFYSLADQYESSVTDNPTQIVSISIDGRRKQVVDYVGLQRGMPLAVSKLEDAIDRVAGSQRWIKGNANTISTLESEHWNFKSAEAAATLARAAENGDAELVRDLVLAGVPLSGRASLGILGSENDPGGSSALVFAARRGDAEMLRVLADAGAVADARVLTDAVVAAASSGNVQAYRLLLSYGGPFNPRSSDGETALMAAAGSGYPAMVRELLRRHADVNAARMIPRETCPAGSDCEPSGRDGGTALMEAVKAEDYDEPPEGVDRVEVVRLLLAAGAGVNARDKQGNTPLILCNDSPEEAELLLKAGADPNARNLDGEDALKKTYDDDVKSVLRKYGAIEMKKADKEP